MKVYWSHEARDRLAEIEAFISRDSPERGENFIECLITRAESLAENPALGRVVPEFRDENIRELLEGNYRIVYRQGDYSVEILTVFEGHRLLKKDEV